MTYKQRTFNLEGKINYQWSRNLGTTARRRIQDSVCFHHCLLVFGHQRHPAWLSSAPHQISRHDHHHFCSVSNLPLLFLHIANPPSSYAAATFPPLSKLPNPPYATLAPISQVVKLVTSGSNARYCKYGTLSLFQSFLYIA